jgi:hypothetical protein
MIPRHNEVLVIGLHMVGNLSMEFDHETPLKLQMKLENRRALLFFLIIFLFIFCIFFSFINVALNSRQHSTFLAAPPPCLDTEDHVWFEDQWMVASLCDE